jgi:hypothetical protein
MRKKFHSHFMRLSPPEPGVPVKIGQPPKFRAKGNDSTTLHERAKPRESTTPNERAIFRE